MNKRLFALCLSALLLLSAPALAADGYWGVSGRPLTCREQRLACSVLQTVMSGCFADFDPANNLDARVFSAALTQLKTVAADDFTHFCDEFGVSAAQLQRRYYIAMGHCLWADIIATPAKDDAAYQTRTVLYLFLHPEGHENAAEQMAAIRDMLTDELIARLAQSDDLPVDFVDYLLNAEDWTAVNVE